MNTSNNQRYRNMDIHMKSAMLELMQKMDFKKITVKNLCEKAQVNRSTFYYHYTDVYDMLDEIVTSLNDELTTRIEAWERDSESGRLSPLVPYLQFFKRHHYFYRTVLENRNTLPIQATFEPLWNKIMTPQESGEISSGKEVNEYSFVAFQGSITAVLRRWIENNCEPDEETLVAILSSNSF